MALNVELFYEPVKILEQLSDQYMAEMTKGQSAFLCGLLREYRPEKIVEIGVAAGGTTAVILNCMNMLNLDSQLFSVDLSEKYYRNPAKKTGYQAEECMTLLKKKLKYVLYTGKYAVEQLDSIGNNIDFLILDTVHLLPGEILDFLAYCPYLKTGAVVVLHDTAMNQYSDNKDAFATRLLLSSVTALKILYEDANIAAFVVTQDTINNIEDLFGALMITWKYFPVQRELDLYRDFYNRHYADEDLKMFDMAVELNRKSVQKKADLKLEELFKIYRLIDSIKGKRVFIYGHGNLGRQFYHILDKCGIDLGGYIVSDGQNIKDSDDVYFLSDVELDCEHDIIFVGVNGSLWEEVRGQLQKRGIAEYIFPNECMFEYLTY